MAELGIYLHWPYCKSKCPYCDFFSLVNPKVKQEEIINDYLQQLDQYRDMLGKRCIKSVFFGGGTPSLITADNIARVLDKIDFLWGIDDKTEISLEANPNTNSQDMFSDLKRAGVNRLSLGIQSLLDEDLRFLGRTHNAAQARQAIEDMRRYFTNCSIDLIYALPNQSNDRWLEQLEQVANLGLKHISLYQLTIEEGTIFARRNVKPMAEEQAAELYVATEDFLANKGFNKYEVSNYSLPDYESRHNLIYWQGGEYIGIGDSAQGRIRIKEKWYAQTNHLRLEEINNYERAEELVIMGLRLVSGINKELFAKLCGINWNDFVNHSFVQTAVEQGWLIDNKKTIKASKEGFLILNKLIEGLCS